MDMEDKGYNYPIYTLEQKIIQEYTGLNFTDIGDLDFDLYKLYFRDAYIYKLQQSEKGQAYLQNAYILEQSEPDREKLRETFNK